MEKLLRHLEVGETVTIRRKEIQCVRTTIDTICQFCYKKKMSKQCPTIPGAKLPVCFASQRPDRESVYFRLTGNDTND